MSLVTVIISMPGPSFAWTSRAKEAFLPRTRRASGMDDDKRELVRRLFVVATELVESAHDAAAKGQSGRQSADDYADAARKLHAAARDIAALAEAATVIATHSAGMTDPTPGNPSIQG